MAERLVVDGKGTEKLVFPVEGIVFEDKKPRVIDEKAVLNHLAEARRLYREQEVGQRSAEVTIQPKFSELPLFIWFNCDDHIGSNLTDHEAFIYDFDLVEQTDNFVCLSNGDEVDSFMVGMGRLSMGVYENPITPQQQGELFQSLFKRLDDAGKMLAFSFGNHNQWLRNAGYKFENTWLKDFRAPVLNCGGLLTLHYGEQTYNIAMTHKFWGASKLNPSNAGKRYLEHQYPNADIVFLGHTHQTEALYFKRGQDENFRAIVIGGTYKVDDEFPLEVGIGQSTLGGITLAVRPDKHDITIFKSVQDAVDYFEVLKELQQHREQRAL